MASDAAETITHEVRIAARPETVFRFFTEPELMARWKGRAARLDPRVGGEYYVEVTGTDIAVGEYLEIDPPKRIVFTWGWLGEGHPVPPGSTRVEITLEADGDETVVRLVHSELPAGTGASHAEGWDFFLPRLALAAAGGDPERDVDMSEGRSSEG